MNSGQDTVQITSGDRFGKPVDMHVHVVGNGSGNTGCWLRVSAWRRPMAALMLRHVGLPATALKSNLDELYVNRLIELVSGSSLGSIVILAQEQVHDDHGRAMPELGSFYVPNE